MTGVGAPTGRVQPDAHRSPWRRLRPRGREGRVAATWAFFEYLVMAGARADNPGASVLAWPGAAAEIERAARAPGPGRVRGRGSLVRQKCQLPESLDSATAGGNET